MATALGGGIAYAGNTLVEGAADFDFWAGRAVAAAKTANDQFDITTDKAVVNREAFKNMALEVGRSVGAEDLTELSKGIYTYEVVLPNKEIYKKGEYKFNEDVVITIKDD